MMDTTPTETYSEIEALVPRPEEPKYMSVCGVRMKVPRLPSVATLFCFGMVFVTGLILVVIAVQLTIRKGISF
jgi:hypothetical protein